MYRFFRGAGWIKALAGRMDAFHLAIYGALRLRRERLADLFSFGFSFAREIPRFRKKRHFCLKKVFTGKGMAPITRLHRRGAALVTRATRTCWFKGFLDVL
jgi:hypothetical protein